MARYDVLSTYTISNTVTALRNLTVRDIEIDTQHAYILTPTHIHKTHVMSHATTSQAITSGIGDSRCITGDNTHIYIAYSTTSGTIVNKIEKRPKTDISTVEATWTIEFVANWTGFTGGNAPVMQPTIDLSTASSVPYLYITCATRGSGATAMRFTAFDKTNGTHASSITPVTNDSGYNQLRLGGGIDNNSIWITYADRLGRKPSFYNFVLNASHQPQSRVLTGNFVLSTSAQGLAVHGGIGWVARPQSSGIDLIAYQLSANDPTAQYARLNSYDINITALKSVTLRDITVSQGYAWVLTNTHFYRHNLTTNGTALNTAITSGIGNSRRITSDSTHIYIAYSTTASTPVNKIEKRSVHTPATVEATWTLPNVSGNTQLQVGLLSTSDDYDHVYVTYLFNKNDDAVHEGIAISKTDGSRVTAISSVDNFSFSTIATYLGAAIDGNRRYDLTTQVAGNVLRRLSSIAISDTGALNTSDAAQHLSNVPAGRFGLAAFYGIGYTARVNNSNTRLVAYQLSFIPPNSPMLDPPPVPVKPLPSTPTNLVATPTTNSIKLNWQTTDTDITDWEVCILEKE